MTSYIGLLKNICFKCFCYIYMHDIKVNANNNYSTIKMLFFFGLENTVFQLKFQMITLWRIVCTLWGINQHRERIVWQVSNFHMFVWRTNYKKENITLLSQGTLFSKFWSTCIQTNIRIWIKVPQTHYKKETPF